MGESRGGAASAKASAGEPGAGFSGSIVAIVTPFKGEDVDLEAFASLV